ncbi:MAG: type II toxin-antitoxin system RelE/ParE family toxin [Verrucomicrobia bacterium]|nr:type II toxin-antitoxin system RelE/ParE family toxin [Candidatus Dechloromonas phosphoritropha]MBP7947899.1 type II toxin-antitoxin system RelE/ParE family toxin [Verrucomicrobiota bacterium]
MMRLVFSTESQSDLLEIAAFIARDNPARARSFVDELEADCARLVDHPGIGAPRPDLREGLRMLTHGRYLIFYRAEPNVVRIERVLHGARNLGPLFDQ